MKTSLKKDNFIKKNHIKMSSNNSQFEGKNIFYTFKNIFQIRKLKKRSN